MSGTQQGVSFREALRVWCRIAVLSFGGPAGQIAVMHRIVVQEYRWVDEARFLHALNYCMLLPGPEAHQLVIYLGWLLHRTRGGIAAGVLFVLPGVISLGVLSWAYAAWGNVGTVQALFFGLRAAVLAIVCEAVVRVGRRILNRPVMLLIAVLSFVALFFFAVPFPVVIVAAAVIGVAANPTASVSPPPVTPVDRRHALIRLTRIAFIGLSVWLGPLLVLWACRGSTDVFTQIGTFNSKMAVTTFGGAYAALAYMAQQAVEHYHWLQPHEMLVGLGFAETTPGPLICVVQFVGFMAAFRNPGALPPNLAGSLGGLIAAWSTLVPSFIWIFAGAPYIESLRAKPRLNAALSGVTAAVVGVIANLSVWLALHTLFTRVNDLRWHAMVIPTPSLATVNVAMLLLAIAAVLALLRFRLGVIPTVLGCSALGVLAHLGHFA